LLDSRLLDFASFDTVARLPGVIRVPISQPLFILGIVFIVMVCFAPGGITAPARSGSARLERRRALGAAGREHPLQSKD